jgi:Leucine-rich repeat (LRR) protein
MLRTTRHIFSLLLLLAASFRPSAQVPLAALDTMKVYHSLEEALQFPEKVYRLDLSKQKLGDFPMEILQLTNLNELILDKCRLHTLPQEIGELENLQVLRCQHNEIEVLPAGLLKLHSLKKLDLADNLISIIPDKIDELAELETMALWDNPIEVYPDALGDLDQLRTLDLLHNQINYDTQERLRTLLPRCKIIMSPPCACQDGGE